MRLTVLIAAAGLVAAARAEEPGFLFDALRLPHYHFAWEKLIKTVDPTPDWLLNFERNYDGAAGALTPVTIEGKPFKQSYVCEPENCAAHKFEVLFDADGIHAYGALGGKDEPPAFFGAPNAALQDVLGKALSPASAAPKAEDAKPNQPKSE
jgi:hypothetical protein